MNGRRLSPYITVRVLEPLLVSAAAFGYASMTAIVLLGLLVNVHASHERWLTYAFVIVPSLALLFPAYVYVRQQRYMAGALAAVIGIGSIPLVLVGSPAVAVHLRMMNQIVPVTPLVVLAAWLLNLIGSRGTSVVPLDRPQIPWFILIALTVTASAIEAFVWNDSGTRAAVSIIYTCAVIFIASAAVVVTRRNSVDAMTVAGAVLVVILVLMVGAQLIWAPIAHLLGAMSS